MAENSKKIGSFQPFNRTIGARCNYPQEELGNEWLLKKTNHLQTWNILHFERTAIISSYFSYMRILYYIYIYISKLIFWTYEPFPLFAPLKVCCWHISTKNCLLKTCANQKKKPTDPCHHPKRNTLVASPPWPRMHPVGFSDERPETNREKTASPGVMSLWSRYLGTFRSDGGWRWWEMMGEMWLGGWVGCCGCCGMIILWYTFFEFKHWW